MIYCDGVEVDSKLGRLIQAFRCDRPSEWQMDEFIQMAEDMHKEVTRLREAEKDAERWRMALSKHENEMDGFEMVEMKSSSHFLQFADVTSHIDYDIDQAMKEKGDE